jgi:Concanavalin A-like lectin/glucanases superfamily
VMTPSGTNKGITLYVDGGSAAGGETIGPRANVTAGLSETGYWHIGFDNLSTVTSQHPAGSNYYGGSLDEVAIYNTALTAQQVQDHYYAS